MRPFTLPIFLLWPSRASQSGAGAEQRGGSRATAAEARSAFQAPTDVSAEGVDQDYAAASPNDTDLGEQAILKRVEKYEPFTLETGVPIYYTSNVALVDRGRGQRRHHRARRRPDLRAEIREHALR